MKINSLNQVLYLQISKAKSLDSADNPKPPSYILGKIQELLSQGNIRTPKLPVGGIKASKFGL